MKTYQQAIADAAAAWNDYLANEGQQFFTREEALGDAAVADVRALDAVAAKRSKSSLESAA